MLSIQLYISSLILLPTDSPTAVVSYNQSTSMPDQPLYLVFDHGAPGPTIMCSGDGYLPPTLQWVLQNGQGLPHGIFQRSQSTLGGVQLRWLRPMEFTDSGRYFCQASNRNGNSSAILDVLVRSKSFSRLFAGWK